MCFKHLYLYTNHVVPSPQTNDHLSIRSYIKEQTGNNNLEIPIWFEDSFTLWERNCAGFGDEDFFTTDRFVEKNQCYLKVFTHPNVVHIFVRVAGGQY